MVLNFIETLFKFGKCSTSVEGFSFVDDAVDIMGISDFVDEDDTWVSIL